MRGALLLCVVILFVGDSNAQPVQCREGSHCPTGFYCKEDTLFCQECLFCEDLKREPPVSATSCVKSVVQCGPCLEGLVEDRQGDVNAECVQAGKGRETASPATTTSSESSPPGYVWAIVAVGLLLLVLLVGIVLYALRNTDTLKILASTRASVQAPCVSNGAAASAPELPPPYTGPYSAPRPLSPPAPSDPADDPRFEERPFIKRADSESQPQDSRESAGSQAARVYNHPAYLRGVQLPPSYESTLGEESDHEPPIISQDDETIESPWTPADTTNNNVISTNESGSGDSGAPMNLSAMLAAARGSALGPSPAKVPCVRQEPNNNRESSEPLGHGESSGGNPRPPSPSHGGPSFIINVVQNINTVQQRNDVTL